MKNIVKKIIIFVIALLLIAGCSYSEEALLIVTTTPSFIQTHQTTTSPTFDSRWATAESYLATNWAPVYATLESRGVKCEEGYSLEVPEIINNDSNATWSIFTCSPSPKDTKTILTPGAMNYSTRYTKILKTDFSEEWIISHKDFSWSDRPNAFLISYVWSQDGNYVYMIPATNPSGGGYSPYIFFLESKVLYRLNLKTGKFETILPYYENKGYAYALSPSGQYLAYAILHEKNIIHIRDFTNEKETEVEIDGNYILTGAFEWKADSQKLVFASALEGWDENLAGISVFVLNLPEMRLQTIVYNDFRLLVPNSFSGWESENTIYLTSLNQNAEYFMEEFTLNIRSGSIIILPSATPWPTYTQTP